MKLNILLAWFVLVSPLVAAEHTTVQIQGRILPPQGQTLPKDGLPVVLLKFQLQADGNLSTTGPLAHIVANAEGHFAFAAVPLDPKAAYRLGTRFQGELTSSSFFFMQPEQASIQVDIQIPGVTEEVHALQVAEVSIFVESGIGQVSLTEVIDVHNPTPDSINTQNKPFILALPSQYAGFEYLDETPHQKTRFAVTNEFLQIYRAFPPGNTRIVYHYLLPANWGSHTLRKSYQPPLPQVQLYTPDTTLALESAAITFTGKQPLGHTQFLSWQVTVPATGEFTLHIQGIPMPQIHYVFLAVGLFITLMTMAWLFIKFRLRTPALPQH